MWEAARRYQNFSQFHVIGKSHNDRMLPMLEIGKGKAAVFCLSGLRGTDTEIPGMLTELALEYCKAYECKWPVNNAFDLKEMLDEIRLCFIPVFNPDGYAVCQKGYSAIRNPVCRQIQKSTDYHLKRCNWKSSLGNTQLKKSTGTPEQFNGETVKQPSILLEQSFSCENQEDYLKDSILFYDKIHFLPLEFLSVLDA